MDPTKYVDRAADAAALGGPIAILLFTVLIGVIFLAWRLWVQNDKLRAENIKLGEKNDALQEKRVEEAKYYKQSYDHLIDLVENLDRHIKDKPSESTIQALFDHMVRNSRTR